MTSERKPRPSAGFFHARTPELKKANTPQSAPLANAANAIP